MRPSRRDVLGAAAGLAALPLSPRASAGARGAGRSAGGPLMVGSANALAGMREVWERLVDGDDAPLDAAIEAVGVVEADETDTSVGKGGLPNEDGVVQLDAACMDGATHNSGAVAALENVLHPAAVARDVMRRTDHCLLVGRGAYEFARAHGHDHAELLTDLAREKWLAWKERMSDVDDRLPPPDEDGSDEDGERHGTVHCSVLSATGELACTTTTSGLAFKIPGRVGDSPIVGAGLYCDQESGSAGSTGRGEAAILANGSFAVVELMRGGMAPVDAGLEVLERIVRQTKRQASWQPGLWKDGAPSFHVHFYVLSVDGRWAGVTLREAGREFAVADVEGGPRLEPLVALLDR